jgi:hypothetical protein
MAWPGRIANPAVPTRPLRGLTLPPVHEATASLRPRTHKGRTVVAEVVPVTAHRQALAPWEAAVLALVAVEGSTDRPVADHTVRRDVAN